jgi:hypothetical protein
MELNKDLEQKLKSSALKYLEKGRANWDVPHTLACVFWMKELLKYERGNPKILISAMYLHDIGGAGLFGESHNTHRSQEELKPEQMKISKELSEKILRALRGFSEGEISEILYLVGVHDDYREITSSESGQLVFEADGLGQIDINRVKPTFSKEDRLKFLQFFEKERASRYKTESGKKFLNQLLPEAYRYCKEEM